MTIMAPKNKWELSDMMKFAVNYDGPIAIRYPRGEAYCGLEDNRNPIELGKSEVIHKGSRVVLLALGSMVKESLKALEILQSDGIDATLVNARFAKPFDKTILDDAAREYELIVTLEENVQAGGFGQQVMSYLNDIDYTGKYYNISVPDKFVEHGSTEQLFELLEIDYKSIARRIKEQLD